MQLRSDKLNQQDLYKLMSGVIVPRPIGWISTVDVAGVNNLAPFSFFNGVGSSPPAVSVSISYVPGKEDVKDSLRNISETGCFVVNIADTSLAHAVDKSAGAFDTDVDEFEEVGLTALPGEVVRAPRVAEAPVSLECSVLHTLAVGEGPGSSTLVVGKIEMFHIRDGIFDPEKMYVDVDALDPLARLAGTTYARLGEIFTVS